MAIKLFGHVIRHSINTLKLRVALAEAGAEYEYVPVDLAAGQQRKPEFLALNQHGKIPVLVDGDFVLPESDAILWYIAERFPDARLLGATIRDRARTLQWCDFASTGLYPPYYDVYAHTLSNPPDKRIPSVAESAQQRLSRALKVLEEVLSSRPALAGADYSIADIGAGVVIRGIRDRLGLDPATHPRILEWYGRISSRPAWQLALS